MTEDEVALARMVARWIAQCPKHWFVRQEDGSVVLVIPRGEEGRIPSFGAPAR